MDSGAVQMTAPGGRGVSSHLGNKNLNLRIVIHCVFLERGPVVFARVRDPHLKGQLT